MSAGRIVIFVPGIHAFGGVERLVVELSRYLNEKNKPHTVLCLNRSIDLAAHADWPMHVQSLDTPRNPIAEGWVLARYFSASDNATHHAPLFFDLKGAFYAGLFHCPGFHLHLTDPPSLLPKDVSKRAFSVRSRIPAAEPGSTGWAGRLRGEAVHRINKRGVRRARTVIAMTNAIANEITALYDRRAIVVPPGVSPSVNAGVIAPVEAGPLHFLSVSRLEGSKRIDWILRAFAELENRATPLSAEMPWVLDVVGDGSEAAPLRSLAAGLGIADRVTFHGHLSDQRLEELFARAGVFLMPAIQGYGLPALELLARGTPVILHRQSGVSEILNQAPWIETITRGQDDLVSAIHRMVANISSGSLRHAFRPTVPTASGWAKQIAATCGWT